MSTKPGQLQNGHDLSASLFVVDTDIVVVRVSDELVATRSSSRSISSSTRFESSGESGSLCGVPSRPSSNALVEHAGCQVTPNKPKHPAVRDARWDPHRQSIVINPVEKLRKIQINDKPIAFRDINLRLWHRLVSRAPRPKAIAVPAERWISHRLKQYRLLDHAVNYGRNAGVAHSAGRFGICTGRASRG